MPRSLRWSNYCISDCGKFMASSAWRHAISTIPVHCRFVAGTCRGSGTGGFAQEVRAHRSMKSVGSCWKPTLCWYLSLYIFISLLICVGFVPDSVSTIFWIFLRHVLPSNHQFYFWFESSFDLGFPCFRQKLQRQSRLHLKRQMWKQKPWNAGCE